MSKAKGNRAELDAAEIYQRVGYRTFRPPEVKYGPTDMYADDGFGGFDILAVPPANSPAKARLSQVKSNQARGVESWSQTALTFASGSVAVDMLVRHDGHGGPNPTPPQWRLIRPTGTATPPYRTVCDERKRDGVGDGDGIVAWLEMNVNGIGREDTTE